LAKTPSEGPKTPAIIHTPYKYPLGSDAPFDGLTIANAKGDVLIDYKPNPKQWLMHNTRAFEVFFGGATCGGKSYGLIMHTAAHCLRWGKVARTVIFRRTYDELEKSIIDEFRNLFDFPFEGALGEYKVADRTFVWANGAKTYFRHMERPEDLKKNQGTSFSFIGYDELTHFEEDMYTAIFPWCRSPKNKDVFCQVISTSNPRGIGHRWVKARFLDNRVPYKVYEEKQDDVILGSKRYRGRVVSRVFIPALVSDNDGMDDDSQAVYLANLQASMSQDKFQAYVRGDWNLFEGVMFPEWDKRVHVVDPFDIPDWWKVIRLFDPGYNDPFYVGWMAQNPETGEVFLINEWAGIRVGPKGGVHGAEMSIEDIRDEIVNREKTNAAAHVHPEPRYGVADDDMWKRHGHEMTSADIMNQGRILFRKANKNRKLGIQVMHSLLRPDFNTGLAKFKVFKTCKWFIDTVPELMRHEDDPDDVAPNQLDHPFDAVRYGLVELVAEPVKTQDAVKVDKQIVRKMTRRLAYV